MPADFVSMAVPAAPPDAGTAVVGVHELLTLGAIGVIGADVEGPTAILRGAA